MAKKTVTKEELSALLLKEVQGMPGLEGVLAINIHLLVGGERENGANWALANFNAGLANIESVEEAIRETVHWMQREYTLTEEE